MVRKSKGKKHKSSAVSHLSPQALAQSADAYYQAADYKNALPRYERLSRIKPDELHQERLTNCLLQRAQQLREKQMYIEANILFTNLQKIDSSRLPLEDYIQSLIHAKHYEKAFKLCNDQPIDPARLPNDIAIQMIAYASTASLKKLPSPIVFAQEISIFQKMIDQFERSDFDPQQLSDEVKQISLRSPLKDLRLTVQAMLLLHEHPHQAAHLVKNISPASPLYSITQVITLLVQPVSTMLQILPSLTQHQQNLLRQLKGWDQTQLNLMSQISILFTQPKTAYQKIQLILNLSPKVPESLTQPLAISLYDGQAATWKLLSNHANADEFTRARYDAILAEKHPDPWHSIDAWERCIHLIQKSKKIPKLYIGMIRLHQYQIIKDPWHPPSHDCLEWLIESLDYFPRRKETYLEICAWYAEAGHKKQHLKWLEKMRKTFPEDIQVLLNSAKIHFKREKFTKTISELKTVLSIDPINIQAKQLFARCHLAKALQATHQKKYNLASKSLAQMKPYESALKPQALAQVAACILAYEQQDITQVRALLQTIYRAESNHLFANFLLLHHYYQFPSKSDAFSQLLSLDNPEPMTPEMLNAGLLSIESFLTNHEITGYLVLDCQPFFDKMIRQVLAQTLTEADYASLCRLLCRLHCFQALSLLVDQAARAYPNAALFKYYNIFADVQGDASAVSKSQYHALISALKSLPDEGDDTTTHHLIAAFLDKIEQYINPFSEFMSDSKIDALLESLFD